ncbi:unnamed protein product, partial [Symbiodinium sp. KB8]
EDQLWSHRQGLGPHDLPQRNQRCHRASPAGETFGPLAGTQGRDFAGLWLRCPELRMVELCALLPMALCPLPDIRLGHHLHPGYPDGVHQCRFLHRDGTSSRSYEL